MSLTIDLPEATGLANDLARLTGESPAEAVVAALRERLAREKVKRDADFSARILALAERLRVNYDTSPVTQAELDEACGEPL